MKNLLISTLSEELFSCNYTRFDVSNFSLVIETFLNKDDLKTLKDNVTPGAVKELYILLGKPKYYDSTWTNSNTLKLKNLGTMGGTMQNMRDEYIIYVKNLSSSPVEGTSGIINVKIEGIIGS
jgi:hypothetical protein